MPREKNATFYTLMLKDMCVCLRLLVLGILEDVGLPGFENLDRQTLSLAVSLQSRVLLRSVLNLDIAGHMVIVNLQVSQTLDDDLFMSAWLDRLGGLTTHCSQSFEFVVCSAFNWVGRCCVVREEEMSLAGRSRSPRALYTIETDE